jgi:predicted transcriptional regulator
VKYRKKVEIVADILDVVRSGAKKTHIMYKCNLSFKLTNAYLDAVLRAGLIVFNDNNDGHYFLTRKGKAFLEKYNKYNRYARSFERQRERVRNEMSLLEQMCFIRDLADNDDSGRNNDLNKSHQVKHVKSE